jgi:hypothetical protein
MARGGKRPGAGRKALKSGAKSSQYTTRITPELRAFLVRAAKAKSRSLSTEIERRLAESKELEDWLKRNQGEPRNVGLGQLVGYIARIVERTTGENWSRDAFTFATLQAAIRNALNALEHNYRPVVVPQRVKDDAVLVGQEERTPEQIGAFLASATWAHVRTIDKPNRWEPNFSKDYYALAKLRDLLGISKV